MNGRSFKTLSAFLWFAPVAICLRYWQLWNLLPARMATHFDAAGHPNGWMTRAMSLYWSAGFLALMAAIFFVVLFAIQKKCQLTKLSWTLLAFLHAEIWTLVYLMNSMAEFSLNPAPLAISHLPIVSAVGMLVVLVVALTEKRGAAFESGEILAEEVHSGRKLTLLFLVPPVILAPVFLAIPLPTVRLATSILAVIMLAAFAMAWDGFHYYFTPQGVEIRTLGFRLKSIPLLQIKNYEIQSWSPIRGYGIRGVGNCKAYVWGNNGVRLDLFDGSVFLGHSDPQRIVHDLNVIKHYRQL